MITVTVTPWRGLVTLTNNHTLTPFSLSLSPQSASNYCSSSTDRPVSNHRTRARRYAVRVVPCGTRELLGVAMRPTYGSASTTASARSLMNTCEEKCRRATKV